MMKPPPEVHPIFNEEHGKLNKDFDLDASDPFY